MTEHGYPQNRATPTTSNLYYYYYFILLFVTLGVLVTVACTAVHYSYLDSLAIAIASQLDS